MFSPSLRFKEFNSDWVEVLITECIDLMTDFVANGSFESLRNNVNVYSSINFAYYVRLYDLRLGLGHSKQAYIDEESFKFLKKSSLNQGDILIANIGANVGEVWQAPLLNRPATIAPNMILLKAKSSINQNYLYYYLKTELGEKEIQSTVSGSGQPKVNKTELKRVRVKLPPSIEEQNKIAWALLAIDEKITQLTQKHELLNQYKKGVMQKIFSQELRFKDEDGTEFPEWKNILLGEMSEITTGTSNRIDSTVSDGKYTFFDRSQDIRTSAIYLFDSEAVIVAGEGQEFIPKHFIGKFDLHQRTYAIMNFINFIGKYIFYYIYNHRNYFLSQAVGSTVKSLRLPMFTKMPILQPCLKEQTKIANFLSAIDEKIKSAQSQLELVKQYKQGLLQQMFV
jgi:type I restriction enzyme S subunit